MPKQHGFKGVVVRTGWCGRQDPHECVLSRHLEPYAAACRCGHVVIGQTERLVVRSMISHQKETK